MKSYTDFMEGYVASADKKPAADGRMVPAKKIQMNRDDKNKDVAEKIDMDKADMGDVIKDFQDSDAPQFKGKSKDKRREMAIAAKLSAEELSAKQKKIDKNNNGKIDGADLARLRSMRKEEIEMNEELTHDHAKDVAHQIAKSHKNLKVTSRGNSHFVHHKDQEDGANIHVHAKDGHIHVDHEDGVHGSESKHKSAAAAVAHGKKVGGLSEEMTPAQKAARLQLIKKSAAKLNKKAETDAKRAMRSDPVLGRRKSDPADHDLVHKEDQSSEWQKIQSMDKGSVTSGKEGVQKRIAHLNAVHAFQKKHGKDTSKTKKSIEALNRHRISEETEVTHIVKYHDAQGNHKNDSKPMTQDKARAHAAKGNAIDKVGGKYSVHKINEGGPGSGRISAQDVKQGIGIARDKRYAGGNMTGASKAMNKLKKGLSDHPRVKDELRKQNEDAKQIKENNEMEKKEMMKTQLHFIKYAADEIIEYIDMGGEIEEWYQNKVSKACSDFEGLHAYMEGTARKTGLKEEELDSQESDVDYDRKPTFAEFIGKLNK